MAMLLHFGQAACSSVTWCATFSWRARQGIVEQAPASTSTQLDWHICAPPQATMQAFEQAVIVQLGVAVQASAQCPPGQSSVHDFASTQSMMQLPP
jgi:hypothetical protein